MIFQSLTQGGELISGVRSHFTPPCHFTPPYFSLIWNKGGVKWLRMANSAEGRIFLWFWCSKSLGQRYRNALKTWFLQRKPRFPSVQSKKNPPAAGYTPSNVQFILLASTAYSSMFSNLQVAIALSTHAQNVFTNWLARYDLVIIIFTGGYRALYTCTKRVYKL